MYGNNNPDIEKGLSGYEDQMNQEVRAAFVRKVLGIVVVQLIITTGIASLICFNEAIFSVYLQMYLPILVVSTVVAFGSVCAVKCVKTHPGDYVLLLVFTIAMALIVSGACCAVESTVVVTAFMITACVVVCLTVYALVTKTDFTGCGPYLFGALFVLIFIGIFTGIGWLPWGNWVAYAGVIIFSLYLIYDVQLCTGKFGIEYSIDDFVIAAMNIYLDILNLFLYILQILESRDNCFVCLKNKLKLIAFSYYFTNFCNQATTRMSS